MELHNDNADITIASPHVVPRRPRKATDLEYEQCDQQKLKPDASDGILQKCCIQIKDAFLCSKNYEKTDRALHYKLIDR